MAATNKDPTAKEIWDTLSSINVNKHTEDRGGLTYLSWAWAWGMMMEHYPDLSIKWHGQVDEGGTMRDIQVYPGGSSMVNCSITIGNVTREMWLPVMDYRHKAIANADSRSISDARMRCLTKCFALFGLGHYIYAGEDLPQDATSSKGAPKKTPKPKATKKAPEYKSPKKSPKKAVEEAKEDRPSLTYDEVSIDESITKLKETVTDLHKRGWTPADDAAKKQITDAIKNRDGEALVKLREEILALGESALKLHDAEEEKDNA